jgi:hypothetical protein
VPNISLRDDSDLACELTQGGTCPPWSVLSTVGTSGPLADAWLFAVDAARAKPSASTVRAPASPALRGNLAFGEALPWARRFAVP